GVGIVLGVLRQELMRMKRAVGAARDDVGEGAAAIDPEIPARRRRLGHETLPLNLTAATRARRAHRVQSCFRMEFDKPELSRTERQAVSRATLPAISATFCAAKLS